jgi:hypothetical protein
MTTTANTASIRNLLNRSAFRAPHTWRLALLIVDDVNGVRLTSRAQFASELRANDLEELAHECTTRKVLRGHVLTHVNLEAKGNTAVRFVLVKV